MTVTPVEQGFWSDIYRTVMWEIAKGVLWLLDGFFDIIDKIWRYRFFDNEYVNKIFGGAVIVACSWLVLKVIIELVMKYIIKGDDRSSPLSVYKGIVLAIVMMFLIIPLFQFGHNVSTELTDAVIEVSGMSESSNSEGAISKAIIRAMVYDNQTESDDIDYLVNNWKTIDINETTGGFIGFGDCYVYSLNFFMLIVLSIVTIFLLFFVAIQMAKRVMEIALYKILAPFCCTGLTNENSKSFEIWCKSSMGVFLITVVQFVCIGLLLNLFGSAFTDNGTLTGIFLVIGALLFIISTPTIVSTLLNQQSGLMTAFGDVQSLMALGSGVSQGLGIAKAGVSTNLSAGSKIVGGGTNLAKGGINNISNMLNKGNKLTPEQQSIVKESINNHNPRKAYQQVSDFLKENRGQKSNDNVMKYSNSNPFKQPYSMKYNPIRNQYMSQNGSDNIYDRKWY